VHLAFPNDKCRTIAGDQSSWCESEERCCKYKVETGRSSAAGHVLAGGMKKTASVTCEVRASALEYACFPIHRRVKQWAEFPSLHLHLHLGTPCGPASDVRCSGVDDSRSFSALKTPPSCTVAIAVQESRTDKPTCMCG
jgi:hypothetical protein